MDHNQFQELLSAISRLSPAQKQQVQSVLQGATEAVASLEAIKAKLAETRMCPRCDTPGADSWGKVRGLQRYMCKACKRTFNAATGTALQGVHKKERWLTYGECLSDGLTTREGVIFSWQMIFLSYCNNLILFLTFLDFFLDLGFFSK